MNKNAPEFPLQESHENAYSDDSHLSETNGNGQAEMPLPKYFDRKARHVRPLAALLLVLFSPLILLTMLLVRLTSAGPAIYRQTRVGKGGELFKILKIRTMYSDAEELSGPTLCKHRDSRITPVGRILRFLHLDELPQLLNVIRGEMCLIGPRPERPEIIEKNRLNESVSGFSDRTRVLPGVTGLAQINLPADQTAECAIPKVKLDLEYIETANLGLDLRILLCTATRMLGVRHGRAVRLFGLTREVRVTDADVLLTDEEISQQPPRDSHTANGRAPLLTRAGSNGDGTSPSSKASRWNEHGNDGSDLADVPVARNCPPRKPR